AEQAGRMQRLVEDLLTLSPLETDRPPQEERIDMTALVQTRAAEARALSAGRHDIRVHADGPAFLLGSGPEIHSALGNLASNAVRYTPEGGQVTLRWEARTDSAAFTVEDTGIGIDPRHIPRLTERFYRVDRGRSRDSGGTGLGLAIVKHVLERHQARLHVASEPGRGSQFAAIFPLRRVG
ncbi:PAS domain-containing sensor histidine kinase, partial [bacterium]|nr:PAS domain-containing sensor histidine kinase [bacterium]